MRMSMEMLTRLTNAFVRRSKSLLCDCLALSLLQLLQIHKSLSITPTTQAGLTKRVMTIEDIANLAAIEAPKKRGSDKQRKYSSIETIWIQAINQI